MGPFEAIVLVCLSTVSAEDCTSATAVDVFSIRVDSELGCSMGWQEIVARSARGADVGSTTYLKTLCRRIPSRGVNTNE